MKPLSCTGNRVYENKGRLYTKSIDPGRRVYGEKISYFNNSEYREWDPRRSKLSAYLLSNGNVFPMKENGIVLYLGAANGTTVSHISDIVSEGNIYAVEFSPRSFRDLVIMSSHRTNVAPLLADATNPDEYAFALNKVDVVYSDVAQKNQADILADNMNRFGARYGMLCVKARSEDVSAQPSVVFDKTITRLKERGMEILDFKDIGKYEKDHAFIVVERPRTVYSIAFDNEEKYLMVYNPKRKGWEMPGGKSLPNESTQDTGKRECLEESGYVIEIIGTEDIGYCDVCSAKIIEKISDGEMESRFFDTLPENLAFDSDEYERTIPWAREEMKKRKQ